MNQEMEKQLSKVLEDIQSLKQSKLEKTDIKQLKDEFEASKAKMVDFSRRTIQAVTAQIDQSTQRQRSLIEKLKEEFDIGRITATVETTVIEKLTATLDDKQKETLKEVKKENEEVLKSIPARIAETVRKEVYEQVGPVNLQKIIEGLSEYKALKSLSEKMITITEQQMQMQQQQQNKNDNSRTASPAETAAASATLMASQEAIKQSIQHISSELAQLKQKNQSTRAIVETLRIQGVPNTNAALHQFDQVAAVKHIEEMQREIEFMHNNVKMIEPVIKMRAQAIEEKMNAMASIRNTDADNGDSRKRPRTEDVTDGNAMVETTATATSNVAVLEKILEIDAKHQKLLDFLSQYKETVLNDTFPARLEAAMKKIEQVLRNHETFISYLIDPFTTAKKVQALSLPSSLGANESSASNVASDTLGSLNPAMLDAITQLVKQTAEEISLPLQKKIKLLEEKLEAKQQNSNSN
ncbi:hypothetical protein BDF20DRAFT_890925 [Mycotypha africana]|uniref:uncharacterized protein n=1 Tax=Mycotypha africana TaxID=64632 RepID=UPI002300B7B6|nr:uncharacterized protein BDF20DRAFT_890925 [Mycotypha africana]KAI8970377.1 hypothetical protein BDF20DRAFT_890925 [Mycotypha africana]